MNIFESLKKLSKKDNQERKKPLSQKKDTPSYIYLDEQDNKVKEIPLSKLDSAGSALINRTMNYKSVKLIHDSIFH